jgi:plastocyanin
VNKTRLTLASLALTGVLAACSSTTAAPASSVTPANADVTVVARDMKFVQPEVRVKADAAFSLLLRNGDGMPHNVAIYTDSSATAPLFVGEMVTDGEIVYDIPALKAGTYFFRCDLHPDMTGTIVAP